MSASAITTRARNGLESPLVTVETQLPGGLPGFTVVGMPETAVREARDRVKSAIQACGFELPRGRVLVNLAPAELAKEGSRYDLAIATSILCATGQLPYRKARSYEYLGELSLFGELRAARGALCAALATDRPVVLAPEDARQAQRLGLTNAYPLVHLSQLKQLLLTPEESHGWAQSDVESRASTNPNATPSQPSAWQRIIGQPAAKRALLLAAAGGHHLLLIGPPGSGKSLLARCLIDLLPPLTQPEQREVAAIYSASGYPVALGSRPFREPHHSASTIALAGGGRDAGAGEISLAHRGVLFLDELPHFAPSVLDLLREPLSLGRIELARADYRVTYPAAFQLIAAMNPCPSGFDCRPERCRCTPTRVRTYQGRVSGPLLDRIDLQLEVGPLAPGQLLQEPSPDESTPTLAEVREAAATAQRRQRARQGCLNVEAAPETALAALTQAARSLLLQLAKQQRLSARGQHRLLNVARTLADLAADDAINEACIGEAFAYRQVDWEGGLGVRAG